MGRKIDMDKVGFHGSNLNEIFNTELDNVTLSKRFFSIENAFRRAAERCCNGYLQEDEYEKIYDRIENRLKKLVGAGFDKIHINRDPRGYMLKLKPEHVKGSGLDMDLAGYGVLAPDLRD